MTCLTMILAAVTNSQTLYKNYSSLWTEGIDPSDYTTVDPALQQINRMFGQGPYGAMTFLNQTTVIGEHGNKV